MISAEKSFSLLLQKPLISDIIIALRYNIICLILLVAAYVFCKICAEKR